MMPISTSTSHPQPIAVALKLRSKLQEWGRKQGLWVIMHINADDAWEFFIWDPKTRTQSTDFPEKIRAAIEKYKSDVDAYVARERESAGRADSRASQHPRRLGSSVTLPPPYPTRDGGLGSDCNGGVWSVSPIKGSANAASGNGTVAAGRGGNADFSGFSGERKRSKVDFIA